MRTLRDGSVFFKPEAIETEALHLLTEYSDKFGELTEPPVPVEEILEAHLELAFDFEDLTTKFGASDVLGATWIREKRVLINQSLDPAENPSMEGRFRFTVAHEIGHWHLHRSYYLASEGQASLFGDAGMPSVVCRTSSAKEPKEWQADKFAGYLLMPRRMVHAAWEAEHGARTPYFAKQEMDALSAKYRLPSGERPVTDVARRMANLFRVSSQAMQIRLMDMGLVRLDQQHTLTL
jgi:Zn-dependent peptidase ImmA (M78 family)